MITLQVTLPLKELKPLDLLHTYLRFELTTYNLTPGGWVGGGGGEGDSGDSAAHSTSWFISPPPPPPPPPRAHSS